MIVTCSTNNIPSDYPAGLNVFVEYLVNAEILDSDDDVEDGWVAGVLKKDFDIFKKGWHVMFAFDGNLLGVSGASPAVLKQLRKEVDDECAYISEFRDDDRLTRKNYTFKLKVEIEFGSA